MEREYKTENNNSNIEITVKKLSKFLILLCVLLVVLIVRVEKANMYLRTIAENGTNAIEYETFDDTFIEVETDDKKEKEDYLPLLEELTEDETTTQKQSTTSNNITETTTKDSTTVDNSLKKTYVLNISSKKIHLPNCSFVSRTKEENKKTVKLSTEDLNQYKNDGYTICKTCGGK